MILIVSLLTLTTSARADPGYEEIPGVYLPNLSDATESKVLRVKFQTGSVGNTILFNEKYSFIESMWFHDHGLKSQAKAIYYLLHEKAHIIAGDTTGGYEGSKDELAANRYAAANFRTFCSTQMFHREQCGQLWRSLPDYYKQPQF